MATKTTTQKLDIRWQDRSWRPQIRLSFAGSQPTIQQSAKRETPQGINPCSAQDGPVRMPGRQRSCRPVADGSTIRRMLFMLRPHGRR